MSIPERPAARLSPPLPDGSRNCNPPDISFWALIKEDFQTNDAEWFHQGFWALFVNRFGNWRMGIRYRVLRFPLGLIYMFMRKWVQILGGIKLDYTVKVGRRVKIEHFGGMIIGARSIGDDVVIRQNTTMGIRSMADLNGKPVIGDRVDIGAGAVIVGNVVIGSDSIIGANSVVAFDVPAGSFVRPPKVECFPRRDLQRPT
jgi:serine O-acetyltransferase